MLFELSCVHYPWGQAFSGAYITDTGEIYRYDYTSLATSDAGEPFLDFVVGRTEGQATFLARM